MKNTKRILAALLAALMLLPAMAACDSDSPDTPDTSVKDTASGGADTTASASGDTSAPETEPRETERHEIKDDLPADLNYNGRTFTMYIGRVKTNETFIAGVDEKEGDVINDAVFRRNDNVQTKLNIKLKSDGVDQSYNTIAPAVSTLILAGDSTYDIFMGQQWGMTTLISRNMFVNAYELEHINFEQPWWMNNYMNELTLGTKYRFLLVSDFNTQAIDNIRVNIFNKTLYEKVFGDPNDLYQLTLDGKLTLDHMSKLMTDVYKDLNGDGATDNTDQLGLITDGLYASVDSFVHSSDVEFSVRDAEGFVKLNLDNNERAVLLAEKLCAFFHQPYVSIKAGGKQSAIFAEGNVLFLGNGMFESLIHIREMEDDFGILPHPKLDETQKEYRSLVHDQAQVTGVSVASKNLDMVGAALEALAAESYRYVTPAYYETTLKMKYSRDSVSTQMVELIKNTMTTNFVFAFNASLNEIGVMYRTMITNNLPNYASNVAARIDAAQTNLDALTKHFKGE